DHLVRGQHGNVSPPSNRFERPELYPICPARISSHRNGTGFVFPCWQGRRGPTGAWTASLYAGTVMLRIERQGQRVLAWMIAVCCGGRDNLFKPPPRGNGILETQ